MNNEKLMDLLKFSFNLSKQVDWAFNASHSFLEICEFERGKISNLKKSNKDILIFLSDFFNKCLNLEGNYLNKIDKKQIKLILDKNFQNIDEFLNKEYVEDLEYRHYQKKSIIYNENIKFVDLYESERNRRIKESLPDTYNVLKNINSKKIELEDKSVWDSLKNGINHLSEFWEMNPYQCVEVLINEYENNYKTAEYTILSLSMDPSRQNLSEQLQKEMWNSCNNTLIRLPQTGEDSLHIYDGKIVYGKDLSKKEKELASKALDFLIKGHTKDIYTYNKYNKWVGGSTDDVFKDVRNLIESIQLLDIKVLFILDGNYWDDGKRDVLREYNSESILITCTDNRNSDEVKNFICS